LNLICVFPAKKESAMGIDLHGHGGLTVGFDTWKASRQLAHDFGWTPAQQPSDNPSLYDYRLGDHDAREFALALYGAVTELERGWEPPAELKNVLRAAGSLAAIRELADYAIVGGFGIG
jgi:hypothetical protein